jgi:hypothetical protein
MATLLLASVAQFSLEFLPGREYTNFYVCTGTNPEEDQHLSLKWNIPLIVAGSISFDLYLFVMVSSLLLLNWFLTLTARFTITLNLLDRDQFETVTTCQ